MKGVAVGICFFRCKQNVTENSWWLLKNLTRGGTSLIILNQPVEQSTTSTPAGWTNWNSGRLLMSETGKKFPGRSENDILCPFFIYNTLGHCNTCIYSRKGALFPCSPIYFVFPCSLILFSIVPVFPL
jgi:hypothetical protein